MMIKKIFLFFISVFMLLSFHQCTVANRGNQKKTLKKALKNDNLSVADFLKNIEIRKPKYSDTTTLNTFSTQFELRKNLIEKLQLKNSHLKAKKYYVQYRIDFSKNFNSIIISASRNQEMYNYIINYDSNDKIIDLRYVASTEGGAFSQFTKDGIRVLEAFPAGDQAIIEEDYFKLKDDGKFE